MIETARALVTRRVALASAQSSILTWLWVVFRKTNILAARGLVQVIGSLLSLALVSDHYK